MDPFKRAARPDQNSVQGKHRKTGGIGGGSRLGAKAASQETAHGARRVPFVKIAHQDQRLPVVMGLYLFQDHLNLLGAFAPFKSQMGANHHAGRSMDVKNSHDSASRFSGLHGEIQLSQADEGMPREKDISKIGMPPSQREAGKSPHPGLPGQIINAVPMPPPDGK